MEAVLQTERWVSHLPAVLSARARSLGPRLRRHRLKPGVYREARAFGMTPPNVEIQTEVFPQGALLARK